MHLDSEQMIGDCWTWGRLAVLNIVVFIILLFN